MLKSVFRTVLSKLSMPLWLALLLSITVPVLAAQQHRATSRFNAMDASQVNGAIIVSPSSLTISEPNESDDFTISLDDDPGPGNAVTVPLSAQSDECTLSVSQVILKNTNWESGEVVTVSAEDDDVADGPQSCDVQIGPTQSANMDYDNLTPPDFPVTVNDDDEADIQVSPTSLTVTEGDAPDSFNIGLSSEPIEDVTIDLTAGDECTVNVTSVTFTSDNWQSAQSVEVSGVEDGIVDGTQECLVATAKTTTDPSYSPVTVDDVNVTVLDGDLPTVQFSASDYNVDEDAGQAEITVTLSAPAPDVVTVTAATTGGGTATAGSDYTAVSEDVTITAGEQQATFDVPILDDPTDEDPETVALSLSNPSENATLDTPNSATLTITDDDPEPSVHFTADTYSVNEGDDSRVITVELSEPSEKTVRVDYTTGDGTATAGEDYTTTTGNLQFEPGDTSETFTVPIIDDNVYEPEGELINLALSGANNAKLGTPNTAQISINDNDSQPTVRFSRSNYSVDEGDGSATITVTLSAASNFPAFVNFSTVSGGSATPGSDYTVQTNRTVGFSPGVTINTVEVPINDDIVDEDDETVNLALSDAEGATLDGLRNSVLTIRDNDGITEVRFASATYSVTESAGTATIDVVRSGTSGFPVSVDYATTGGGSATPDQDYTPTSGRIDFGPNETSKSFEVPVLADQINEPDETVNLELSNESGALLIEPSTAVLTIHDSNETPAVQFSQSTYTVDESKLTASITVSLNIPTAQDVNVFYAVEEGTATLGEDFATSGETITIPAGQTVAAFTITQLPDELDEPDETVLLSLTGVEGADLGQRTSASLVILDNDPAPTISFSLSSLIVGETGGTADLPVRLNATSGRTVTVNYRTIDGSAKAHSDYVPVSGVLTLSPGESSKTINVPLLQTDIGEPDETFFVELSAPTNASLGTPDEVTVTIVDGKLVRFSRFFPISFSNYALGEPNDSCQDAYEIMLGRPYFFAPDDLYDWYQFTLSEPGNLIVEVNNFVPKTGQIGVGKGATCADASLLTFDGDPGLNNTFDLGFQEAGQYYIYVANDDEPTSEQYELHVRLE